jgi:rhodanese-related sulfurtransferase
MGSQSANAGETLKKDGFENSLILSGGINQWRMDNLPLV